MIMCGEAYVEVPSNQRLISSSF